MRFRTFFILFSILSLSSCITSADQQPQANKILQQLNQSIQKHQWEQAEALFDPKFFKQMPKKYWEQQMKAQIEEKGEIQAFNLVSQQKDPRFGGDFYIYVMSVVHEHGTSHETVTIIKPIDDKPMTISGFLFK
ncbi:MAG: hypothetical protein COA61_001565 [Zetaproteobacteria bacterium]|nr:hypothetical protein [Zetaproteobacteria bacterium]